MKKLVALVLLSGNALAAPTIDDATGVFVSGGSVTSVTTTIDHTAQTNNAIYCSVTIESASETITGVQYDPGGGNQANLTEISSNTAGTQHAEVWAIYEANLPTSATGEQITATFSGSASGKIGCVSFYDASQTAPTSGQISNNSGTGTTLTAGAVTTLVNNDYVFGSFVTNCNSCGDVFSSAVGADTNTLQDQDIANSHGAAMTTHQDTTAGSVNAGVTFGSSQTWAAASAVITAASSTTTWTDTTIDVGQDAAGTLDVAFSGNTTQCEFASGDTISVTANASTTAGDCATAKADFLSGGSLSNTRIASATTAFLRNVTETSTAGSITINSPDDGVTDHFGTAACANPGCDDDSLYENSDFLTEYAAFASGDDVWVTVNTGACDFDATTGVFSCTTLPATGTVRVYDVTATDWLTESTWSIAAPAGAGAFRLSLDSPLRGVLRSPLRAPIQ